MQVFTCLWNLNLLGSSDLCLLTLMVLWSKVMLALIQGLGGIYFKNKIMASNSLMLRHHQCHIHMRVVSMIPHSYLVHFELVQTCCLSSYDLHIHYLDHSRTRHQTLSVSHANHTKARHPPERKRRIGSESSCSWSLVKKIEKKRRRRRGRWQEQKYKWRTCVLAYTCTWSKYLDSIAT